MKTGIKIEFDENDNCHFLNEYDNDIDYNLLIISLFETINDICIQHELDLKEQFDTYLELGSVDNLCR